MYNFVINFFDFDKSIIKLEYYDLFENFRLSFLIY